MRQISYILVIGLLLCLGSRAVWAQSPVAIDWAFLSRVSYARVMDLRSGQTYMKPRFDPEIRRLTGQEVILRGHVIVLDARAHVYILSRYPYAACFFCGGGELASVADVWLRNPGQSFRMDEVCTLRGILRLDESGQGLHYLLEDARPVSP